MLGEPKKWKIRLPSMAYNIIDFVAFWFLLCAFSLLNYTLETMLWKSGALSAQRWKLKCNDKENATENQYSFVALLHLIASSQWISTFFMTNNKLCTKKTFSLRHVESVSNWNGAHFDKPKTRFSSECSRLLSQQTLCISCSLFPLPLLHSHFESTRRRNIQMKEENWKKKNVDTKRN